MPEPVAGSDHRLKYSLFYGREGERLVSYDNERGKGDHRHVAGKEEPYAFTTVEKLIQVRCAPRTRWTMSKKVNIHVGTLDDMGKRFVSAWHRLERGERVRERHVTFADLLAMMSALSEKRLEILREVHREPAPSVKALAERLGRDYKRVHEDVETLAASGLVRREEGRVSAPYDAISDFGGDAAVGTAALRAAEGGGIFDGTENRGKQKIPRNQTDTELFESLSPPESKSYASLPELAFSPVRNLYGKSRQDNWTRWL